MLGARDDAANSNACCVFQFGYTDRLANGLSRLTLHDSNDDDAICGETEVTRGVSSISCSISLAVRQSSFY